jgi:hypothetical protein
VLKEESLGRMKLKKGMPINEVIFKEAFSKSMISKTIGTQDGPNFFVYEIGEEIIINTPDTERNELAYLRIPRTSLVKDEYGIRVGTEYAMIENQRSHMKIATDYHFHTYIYEDDSHIAYEMSTNFNTGLDRMDYTLDELRENKSTVISIVWKDVNIKPE